MDHTNRFTGKSEIYAKARPQYAAGLFEYFQNTLHIPSGSTFADIGAGTGIFTRQLLNCGYRVFAVEPNRDMRSKAEETLLQNENFISVDGTASDTRLPDASVDYITAAQAFHWFDAEAFKKECRRIIKPGGKVMLIYNARKQDAAYTKALAALRQKYNTEFHGFSNGLSNEACVAFFDGKCEIYRVDNTPKYDRQGFINRALSSSYSLQETDEKYSEYLNALHAFFDSFSTDGFITVPTDTVAYIGEVL